MCAVSFSFPDCLKRLDSYSLPPIPRLALHINRKLKAPPRLLAHHFLVHQVAASLVSGLTEKWPDLNIDLEAVLFGAATHDIGKTVALEEFSAPGKKHELLGFNLLMDNSISTHLARFARDHGRGTELVDLEGLVLCTADRCWKGKRDEALEERLIQVVSDSPNSNFWTTYPGVMELLDSISAKGEYRLALQAEFPCQVIP